MDATREELSAEVAQLRRQLAVAQDEETLVRLASLPEQNPDPVIETDLDGHITYLNPVARARFPDLAECGLEHAMLVGLGDIVLNIEGGEESHTREIEVGDFVYVQKITCIPATNLVRIYAHDISVRKRAEEEVRQSEARFHAIFEHNNDAILLIDPLADEIVDANSKAGRLLGYEREELLQLPISKIHPGDMDDLRAFSAKVREEGGGWTDKLSCMTRAGQTLPAEISASCADIAGRSCIIAVVRDLSERERATQVLADEVKSKYNYEEIIGRSQILQELLKQAELVAPTDSSVLILGETGTGKELICRALHHMSPRATQPLVKLNCAAIPHGLIESELFGHEKGAFTGAITQKRGRFELAHEGTIFLDEIGDIPLETQPKLLRLLQEREFERVGGTQTIQVDVRVIAATHRNLEEMVGQGEFREDLFYRLNVFPLRLPPLRQRREDLPLLANYFAHRICARLGRVVCPFNEAAMRRLQEYGWPGNVRELENIVERAVILCNGATIGPEHVHVSGALSAAAAGAIKPLEDMEREHILAALRATGGKVSGAGGAAEMLGLKPSTLESRMKKLSLSRKDV